MQKKIKLKIAVIGSPGSGKTSFINNILSKPFDPEPERTDAYEVSMYKFTNSMIEYQIQLWECGHEHLKYNKYIRSAFFKNCSAAFLTFDLSCPVWKEQVSAWVEEAYQFDCFLVYAIGTKKDVFLRQKFIQMHGKESIPEGRLSDSLLQNNGIETLDEMDINQFFSEFQIKHFYQTATEKLHPDIRNTFITIENDQQKLTRSSLAMGRRFDNSVYEDQSVKEALRSVGSRGDVFYSVKEEIVQRN